jgi:hypothetical protein
MGTSSVGWALFDELTEGQDSIHRRGQNYPDIYTGMRNKPVSRGGPRSLLYLSSISIYSTRIQPRELIISYLNPVGGT